MNALIIILYYIIFFGSLFVLKFELMRRRDYWPPVINLALDRGDNKSEYKKKAHKDTPFLLQPAELFGFETFGAFSLFGPFLSLLFPPLSTWDLALLSLSLSLSFPLSSWSLAWKVKSNTPPFFFETRRGRRRRKRSAQLNVQRKDQGMEEQNQRPQEKEGPLRRRRAPAIH